MHARLHVNLGLVLIRAIHIHTHLLSLMMKPVCCCSTTFLFYFFSFLSYQAPPSGAGENEEIQAVLSNSSKLFGYSCGRINYCDRVSLPKPGYVRATLIPSMCTCVCACERACAVKLFAVLAQFVLLPPFPFLTLASSRTGCANLQCLEDCEDARHVSFQSQG